MQEERCGLLEAWVPHARGTRPLREARLAECGRELAGCRPRAAEVVDDRGGVGAGVTDILDPLEHAVLVERTRVVPVARAKAVDVRDGTEGGELEQYPCRHSPDVASLEVDEVETRVLAVVHPADAPGEKRSVRVRSEEVRLPARGIASPRPRPCARKSRPCA